MAAKVMAALGREVYGCDMWGGRQRSGVRLVGFLHSVSYSVSYSHLIYLTIVPVNTIKLNYNYCSSLSFMMYIMVNLFYKIENIIFFFY